MDNVIVRRARPADRQAIVALAGKTHRRVWRIPIGALDSWLDNAPQDEIHAFYLCEAEGQLGCACGLSLESKPVAQVRIFVLREDWSTREALASMLPAVRPVLCEQKIDALAFVGAEGWLLNALLLNEFELVNTIVTLQKTDFDIPDPGNPHVVVRPVGPDDLEAILTIDRACFEVLWRNTEASLREYEGQCAFFVVAELDDRVVGYACASLEGRYGHVTRIAVHPDYRGVGVGVRILVEVILFFRAQRVFGITLNTQQDNRRARRLYKWFGFSPLGREAYVMVHQVHCQSR